MTLADQVHDQVDRLCRDVAAARLHLVDLAVVLTDPTHRHRVGVMSFDPDLGELEWSTSTIHGHMTDGWALASDVSDLVFPYDPTGPRVRLRDLVPALTTVRSSIRYRPTPPKSGPDQG